MHSSKPGRISAEAKGTLLIVALLISNAVFAQPFAIDWIKVAGGGGSSSSTQYSLSATIGQADAGHMSGGTYILDGGYWSLFAAMQASGMPALRISSTSSNTIVLSWPSQSTGYLLQQSTNPIASANWSNVVVSPSDDGTTKTIVISPATGNRFFRLKQ